MVFDTDTLRYKFTVNAVDSQAPVGPGTMMAGKLLVPVTRGYDVFDPQTGAGERHIELIPPAAARSGGTRRRGHDRCWNSAAPPWWPWPSEPPATPRG